MKIGIDCRTISDHDYKQLGGVGHYTFYLIRKSINQDPDNQYYLFFYNKKVDLNLFNQKNVKCIILPLIKFKKFLPFVYNHLIVPLILWAYHLDIYHNPANIIPFFYFGRSVITIHDLAIYKNPSWFPSGQFFSRRILVPLSIKKAQKIIAVSESTRNDLINIFKVKPEKIKVIYEGVGFDKILLEQMQNYSPSADFKNFGQYFLYLGTLEPRKNLVRVLKAYNNFLKNNPDKNINFILAGRKGWQYEDVFKAIEEYHLGERVKTIGYISPLEKVYLIKNAFAFIYASLYEGFGLPVLEAMYLGTPIITSNVSSIPEIIIDNAILVDPYNVGEIEKGMVKISSDPVLREKLRTRSMNIAQNYTWRSCAKDTLTVYQELFSEIKK